MRELQKEEIRLITPEREEEKVIPELWGRHADYGDLFECPKCGDAHILDYFKYCPVCGVKLDWGEELK